MLPPVNLPDALGLMVLLGVAAALVVAIGAAGVIHALLYPPRKTYAVALGRGLPTDPGEAGYAFESLRLTLADGRETPAWLVAGQREAGPLVVVVHGFGDSRYGAATWLPLLKPHASKVLLYDLRGHGESEPRTATCGTRDVDDLCHILDQLDVRNGVLFGYSMGAGIAIAAGARSPERVAGVVGDGAYRLWDEPIRRHLRSRRLPVWPFVPLAGLALRLVVRGFTRFDRLGHAQKLACPLLLLHGEYDHLCPVESARQLAEAAPDARCVVFESGGHLDLAAADEVKYREALRSFFESLPAPKQESA